MAPSAKWVTITDILGEEDHFGDMDFKLAGTTKGITGFQLDLKINGLPFEIAKAAIFQARDARVEILKVDARRAYPRPAQGPLSKYAPRIQTIQIDPEKIGLLIGPGGKTIRRITETTGAQIDIADDDSGKVFVYSNNGDAMNRARSRRSTVFAAAALAVVAAARPLKIGKLYHRSRHRHQRLRLRSSNAPRARKASCTSPSSPTSACAAPKTSSRWATSIWVKCVGIDERSGKVRLSRKAAMAELEAQKQAGGAPAAVAEAAPIQS